LRLGGVDARSGRVREDLARGGLLEEALDPSVLVGGDDPELERVVDRLEPDRDRGLPLAVELDEPGQVDVAESVAGDDEERVVELAAREPDGARSPEGGLLDRVLDVQAEARPRAEVAPDR